MAKDLGDAIGTAVGRMAREAAQNAASNTKKSRTNDGPVSGLTGVALKEAPGDDAEGPQDDDNEPQGPTDSKAMAGDR
jgi:hypothetical protein